MLLFKRGYGSRDGVTHFKQQHGPLLPEGPRPVLLPDSREKPLGTWKEVGRCVMWRARLVLTMCYEGQGGTQETAGLHPAVDPDVVRRGAGQGYAWGEGQRARARAIGSKAV